MKLISCLAIVALCITAYGASTRVASDGTQYNFEDWSPPQQIDLPSTDVPIPVLRRSMIVERIAFQQPSRFSIDLVSAMNSPSVWIGIPFDHYFGIGEEIYGAATSGTLLLIKRSSSGAQDPDIILERALISEIINDPGLARSVQGATHAFDLDRIFGHQANRPESPRPWTKPVTITSVSPQPTSIILKLNTVAGNDLILTFSHEFDLISASKNGEAVFVLQDGRFPLVNDWPGPNAISLPSQSGPVMALSSSKVYYRDDKRYYANEGQGRLAVPMKAVVIPNTGDIWIGPSDSLLVVQNGSVVGLLPSKIDELRLFTGRPGMKQAEDARVRYQQELSNFENDLLSGRFVETAIVKIPTLQAKEGTISPAPNGISFAGSDVVLNLVASGPNGNSNVELKIDRNLRVTSRQGIAK